MISKFDYKTPGRDDAEEVKLYTRADVTPAMLLPAVCLPGMTRSVQ